MDIEPEDEYEDQYRKLKIAHQELMYQLSSVLLQVARPIADWDFNAVSYARQVLDSQSQYWVGEDKAANLPHIKFAAKVTS